MTVVIKLPDPQKELAYPLMKALELRRTKRKWKDSHLSVQTLSNLLWAACGIAAAETKRSKSKRTVPSARNSQAVSVYIALPEGVYLYDETRHSIVLIKNRDVREFISNQKMMKSAPAGLIYVADFSRLKGYAGTDDKRKWFVSGTETGFISQNVYLYCAAAGLSTAIIGLVNREELEKVMGLSEYQKVIFTQAVGEARE
ncbi:MAG: SagB/ThcOx family dehydrogenase [Bacteroidota bacterium]